MGLQPLGEKWRRRIAVVVGQEIAWANGGGGQVFEFRTPGPIEEHRHGWFDRHAYMHLPPEQRAQPVDPRRGLGLGRRRRALVVV
jgi:hypothetical protein